MNVETELERKFAAEVGTGPVSLSFPSTVARFSLRLRIADLAAASEAFGLVLPERIGATTRTDARRALCLGPDEWMLDAPAEGEADIVRAFAVALAEVPHSLVVIGDREIAVSLEGPQAVTLLSVGCPIDVAALPVGSGRRTVFDGVQVVLRREAPERFTLEIWRSFMPHVWALLNTGNRELALGL